jgi:hypothetical protein
LSRASCDIASKIVTGRSANTLFMEVIGRSAAGPCRQTRSLPGQKAGQAKLLIFRAHEKVLPVNRTRNSQDICAEAVPPDKRKRDAAPEQHPFKSSEQLGGPLNHQNRETSADTQAPSCGGQRS